MKMRAMGIVSFGICVGLAAAMPATAGQAAPSAEVTAGLQELDEIMVRGKRLKQTIVEAEDEFFSLFNNLNKDDDYDTHCQQLNVDPESQIRSRVCMPGFVANAMAEWAASKLDCTDFSNFAGMDGRISPGEADDDDDLKAHFTLLDINHDGFLSLMEYAERQTNFQTNCYQPPPPQLVLMEGTQKWYEHSMRVINSDSRLQKMAGRLDDLYHELWSEQQRLNTVEESLQVQRHPVGNVGPRTR